METDKVAVIGIYIPKDVLSHGSAEYLRTYLEMNFYFRMLFTLGDYLTKQSNKFERVRYILTPEISGIFENGTITGLIKMVNRSEINISSESIVMDEVTTGFRLRV